VSWERWKFVIAAIAEPPVYIAWPPGDPWVASPRGVGGVFVEPFGFAYDHGANDGQEPRTVACEILKNLHRAARESHDGHEIRGRHLLGYELLCRREGPQLVGRRHGRHIEVRRQEAVVLVPCVSWGFRRNLGVRKFVEQRNPIRFQSNQWRRVSGLLQLLEFEKLDGLRD
jgi:hypothetical protein